MNRYALGDDPLSKLDRGRDGLRGERAAQVRGHDRRPVGSAGRLEHHRAIGHEQFGHVGPEHLGRVAGYTARHNPWPLAVVPVGGRHHPPRVVVGVDGSAGAGAAVDWCARHLSAVGPHVVAVDVDEAGAGSDPWSGDAGDRARTDAEIERWTKPLTDAGIEVDHVPLLHQYPADAILHLADARHADIIVVGTRGRGGFDDLQVGGTALKLLGRARVPLVLVPLRPDSTASD